ncbi:MAG: hypothetical protein EBZ77_04545 [Chitinophagia bacterium]|nr:hypothetical protein [Chitinophagia bacterium]
MAYLYSGLRTRYVRKLAERPILVVHTVRITRDARGELVIDVWPNWSCESEREFFAVAEGLPHHQFKEGKVDAIAFMDGFRHENAPEQIIGCGSLMRNFWGPEMFIGHWILWSHVALKTEL